MRERLVYRKVFGQRSEKYFCPVWKFYKQCISLIAHMNKINKDFQFRKNWDILNVIWRITILKNHYDHLYSFNPSSNLKWYFSKKCEQNISNNFFIHLNLINIAGRVRVPSAVHSFVARHGNVKVALRAYIPVNGGSNCQSIRFTISGTTCRCWLGSTVTGSAHWITLGVFTENYW